MNNAHRHFQNQQIELAVEDANFAAWQMRTTLATPHWKGAVADLRQSAVFHTLQSDPYTRRAYTKPRGYAGDAVMLDYLYDFHAGDADPMLDADARRIFQYTVNSTAAKAVRYRREYLARLIDQVAGAHPGARILSIAAGHLREIALSSAAIDGRLSEVIAFDQDAESLAVVERDYQKLPVRTVLGSVRHLLAGKTGLDKYHLVYAAGLFDYLEDDVARRLVERMWAMTLPGGRMMIANFLPGIPDAGYMEAFMDWWLIYRSEDEMRKLVAAIPGTEMTDLRIEFDPGRNICFLDATKAG